MTIYIDSSKFYYYHNELKIPETSWYYNKLNLVIQTLFGFMRHLQNH